MCLTLDSLCETLMPWMFCRIALRSLARPAASLPGRWPNLRGDCGCPAPCRWRCMPWSRDGRGCGSTIQARRSSSRPATSRWSAAAPTTTSRTNPPPPACHQNSSLHAMPAMSPQAIGGRACSCAGHTGSRATSAEVCSRRFRRSFPCPQPPTTPCTTSSPCCPASWQPPPPANRQCSTGSSTSYSCSPSARASSAVRMRLVGIGLPPIRGSARR